MAARLRILPSAARPATRAAAGGASPDYGRSDQPDWRQVPWRRHLRAVTLDARRVHVVDLGRPERPPVLFVHGLGGRWQNWLENIPRAAVDHRAIALDLPGFGRSQPPTAPISIPGYAATLDRLCDVLELDRVTVVGNSMGGLIAVEMALRFPDRVRGLVLVSPAAMAIQSFRAAPASALLALLSHTPLGTPDGVRRILGRRGARHLAFATIVRHPTLLDIDMLCELAGGRGAPGLGGALEAMMGHSLRGRLSRLEVPSLLMHGREDMLVPVADSIWLSKQLPHAELRIFEDTGHLPMVERPVPFNDLLASFAGA